MTMSAIEIRAQGLRRLVGNTPLLAIAYRWRGKPRTIPAKCEQLNLTGSIKDRVAFTSCRPPIENGVSHLVTQLSKPRAETQASRLRPSAGRSGIL